MSSPLADVYPGAANGYLEWGENVIPGEERGAAMTFRRESLAALEASKIALVTI